MNPHPDAQPAQQPGDATGSPERGEAADQHVGAGQAGDDEDEDEDDNGNDGYDGYEEYEPL
ncbi:MAG: hypothetical protein J2P27_03560 [Actinobacteria bacterium]|nr:hypothetical protein [Actinomycetota bacterium]